MSACEYLAGDPAMADVAGRQAQAEKVLAVVEDFLQRAGDLGWLEPSAVPTWRSCLDVGCSTGVITQRLAARFPVVVGIDLDRQALTHPIARAVWANASLRAHPALASALRLPFRNGAFDVIVCHQVYQYVPDVAGLLAEIHRVARPGGVCFFAARNLLGIAARENRLPFLAALAPWLATWFEKRGIVKANWRHRAGRLWPYCRLRALAERWFFVHDYTVRVLTTPALAQRFFPAAGRSEAIRFATPVLWALKPILPTHLWILQKQPTRA